MKEGKKKKKKRIQVTRTYSQQSYICHVKLLGKCWYGFCPRITLDSATEVIQRGKLIKTDIYWVNFMSFITDHPKIKPNNYILHYNYLFYFKLFLLVHILLSSKPKQTYCYSLLHYCFWMVLTKFLFYLEQTQQLTR